MFAAESFEHSINATTQQKWSSCSWLLLREFAKRRQEQEREVHEQIAAGEKSPEALEDLPLPKIPYVSEDPSIGCLYL